MLCCVTVSPQTFHFVWQFKINLFIISVSFIVLDFLPYLIIMMLMFIMMCLCGMAFSVIRFGSRKESFWDHFVWLIQHHLMKRTTRLWVSGANCLSVCVFTLLLLLLFVPGCLSDVLSPVYAVVPLWYNHYRRFWHATLTIA